MVEIVKKLWIVSRIWISKSGLDRLWIDDFDLDIQKFKLTIQLSKPFIHAGCELSKLYPENILTRAHYYLSRAIFTWIKYTPKGVYILSNVNSLDKMKLSGRDGLRTLTTLRPLAFGGLAVRLPLPSSRKGKNEAGIPTAEGGAK